MARYENYIGKFYLRTGKYQAAIRRLKKRDGKVSPVGVRRRDAAPPRADLSLKVSKIDKARAAFSRLFAEYPKSELLGEAKSVLEKN